MNLKNIIVNLSDKYFPCIELNCPQVSNAFDETVISELHQALAYTKTLPEIRGLFLTGVGKTFSAGANLAWMQKMVHYDLEKNIEDAKQLAQLMKALHEFPLPTIALVNGSAYGGGVGLVAACDIAFAEKKACFCLSEVKLGLIPSIISPYVIASIGERAAHRYYLTAEKFDTFTAKKLGLIHDIYSDNNPEVLINNLKTALLQNSPEAMIAAKELIQLTSKQPISQSMIEETIMRIAKIRVSDFGQEGLTAFLEKRKAQWVIKKD